jgi:hypothetical protein
MSREGEILMTYRWEQIITSRLGEAPPGLHRPRISRCLQTYAPQIWIDVLLVHNSSSLISLKMGEK